MPPCTSATETRGPSGSVQSTGRSAPAASHGTSAATRGDDALAARAAHDRDERPARERDGEA